MRKNIGKLLIISMVFMLSVGCTSQVEKPAKKPMKEATMENKEFERVDTEEQFEFYLVYCSWDKLSESNKGFFISMYDGDETKGRNMYENYFLKYNLIHEVSHTVQGIYGVERDLYFTEQGANDLAVAYWREIDPDFVVELEELVNHMINKLGSPIPEGEDESTYFVENYEELGEDPAKYGYFQFKFVKNALNENVKLHDALVKNINSNIKDKEDKEREVMKYQVGDVAAVVKGYADYLKEYNVETPKIFPEDQDTPSIQFVMLKQED